jgi:ATP-binding cassette subfamily B multidrug efflux pump
MMQDVAPPSTGQGTFRRVLRYLTKRWSRVLLAGSCLVLSTILTMIPPLLVQTIFDDVLPAQDAQLLALYAGAILGLTVVGAGFSYLLRYINESLSQTSVYDIRNDLYHALLQQSFSFYDQARTGQLMARATGDITQIRRFFSWGLRALLDTILRFIFAFVILFAWDETLTILSFATAPLIAVTVRRYAQQIGPQWDVIRQQYGRVTAVIQENLMGLRVVKGFAAEDREITKFAEENRAYTARMVEQAQLSARYRPFIDLIAGLNLLFILWYGGAQVINGHLSFGAWLAFNLFALRLTWPIRFLGFITSFYKRAMAAAQRVFELMDTTSMVTETENALDLQEVTGAIQFNHVSFEYEPGRPVLTDITLTVQPGETLAILGATGSGKSSIINLIPRFYDVTAGQITLDGHDIRDLTLTSLRQHIAIVQQEPFIFSTSLKENIAFNTATIDLDAIIAAAKAAQLHEFIMTLPEGYDTPVGERGVTLSGGQKQRLAIARALVTNPKIIIFDASTSNVDTETEHEIQRGLESLLHDRTIFLITQRLSTVKHADTIMILEKGTIIEYGAHDELLALNGHYARLHQLQEPPDPSRHLPPQERR